MEKEKVIERIEKMRKEWAANDAKRDAGLTVPEGLKIYKDISYGPYGEWNLLDIYMPDDGNKYPLIVDIHGGGYFYGDKKLYSYYCMHLATLGFTVVNFNYRLSPENKFPAPLEDTDAVISFIEKHGKEYGLDHNKMLLTGDSAGAQLSSQYAAICTNDDYREKFGFPKHSIKLAGVSLACGMYDIIHKAPTDDVDVLFDSYYSDNQSLEDPRLDVLANITSEYPPVFIFSSKDDFLLPAFEPQTSRAS